MKELGQNSKLLIEMFNREYFIPKDIISQFQDIIYDDKLAQEIIKFIKLIDNKCSEKDPESKFILLHKSCIYALEILSKDQSVILTHNLIKSMYGFESVKNF